MTKSLESKSNPSSLTKTEGEKEAIQKLLKSNREVYEEYKLRERFLQRKLLSNDGGRQFAEAELGVTQKTILLTKELIQFLEEVEAEK